MYVRTYLPMVLLIFCVSERVCQHTHACIHACMYTYMRTYIRTQARNCTHTNPCRTCLHVHMHMHTHAHLHSCTQMQSCLPIYLSSVMHARKQPVSASRGATLTYVACLGVLDAQCICIYEDI